ncbi:MAG: signal peptidase I [Patescibacteria group bacterium]
MNDRKEVEKAAEQTEIRSRGYFSDIWEIVRVLLMSFAIVLPIRYFIAQPFIVSGASMEPNFSDREYLIVDELSYYLRDPHRGEAIIFRYPRDPRQYFIKRIIGLPGETVKIEGGNLHIANAQNPSGVALEEDYLAGTNIQTGPQMTVVLGSNEYFVLGDNRNFSSDSRVWGPLKRNLIVGRAVFRAWPANRVGIVAD